MSSNIELPDGLLSLDYDPTAYLTPYHIPMNQNNQQNHQQQHQHQHQHHNHRQNTTSQSSAQARGLSPIQTSGHSIHQSMSPADSNLLVDWQIQQMQPHFNHYHIQNNESSNSPSSAALLTGRYAMPMSSSPVDMLGGAGPSQLDPDQLNSGLIDSSSYLSLSAPVGMASYTPYTDYSADLLAISNSLSNIPSYPRQQNVLDSSSPTEAYLEVTSLPSSSSDNGWNAIEQRNSLDLDFSFPENGMFIDPCQTLHDQSLSDSSSYSSSYLGGSYVDLSHSLHSPAASDECKPDLSGDHIHHRRVSYDVDSNGSDSPSAVSPLAVSNAVPIPGKKATSPTSSSTSHSSPSFSSTSPPARKPSRRSPMAAKTEGTRVRKQSQPGKPESDKRVGKRKGPLKPDQRKQASEIRKLRACLRCKFLKKTVSLKYTYLLVNLVD